MTLSKEFRNGGTRLKRKTQNRLVIKSYRTSCCGKIGELALDNALVTYFLIREKINY
jgi:hypothetical protein